jgi:hypothetical protein
VYRWWVFLHLLGAFGFLLAHGVSVAMALSLRRERDPERIKALLDLSRVTIGLAYISLLVLLTGGIVSGFLGHWWSQAWIWTALALLIVLIVVMGWLGTGYYDQVRIAVGTQPTLGSRRKAWLRDQPPPASASELSALLTSSRPLLLTWMGVIGLAVILWLMVLKPF